MKEGWKLEKLGDVLKVIRGSSPRPIKNFISENEDGVNWIKIGDVGENDKYVTSTRQKITAQGALRSRYVEIGDFIFSNSMSFGRAYIMKIDGYIHDGWFSFKLPKNIDHNYLWYLFRSPNLYEQIQKLASGAIVLNVSGDLIKKAILPIPPLPEQQAIVEKLDFAFDAIEKAKANIEKNIENAKELFQSKLNAIFSQKGDGWEEKTLKEICTKIGSGATPRGGQQNYKSEGVSLIRSMNVYDWEFRKKNLAFIDDLQAKELNGVTLHENDVLLNITGASVARCCVVPSELLPARVNQHVSIIRPKNEIIDSKFLNLLLTSKLYKDQLLFTGEQGATRQAITKAQIEIFEVMFPKTIQEQQKIVNQVDKLSEQLNLLDKKYKLKLSNLEELKKSILEKAFKGELV